MSESARRMHPTPDCAVSFSCHRRKAALTRASPCASPLYRYLHPNNRGKG